MGPRSSQATQLAAALGRYWIYPRLARPDVPTGSVLFIALFERWTVLVRSVGALRNPCYVVADPAALPVASSSCDVVVLLDLSSTTPSADRMPELAEQISRVLTLGGTLLVGSESLLSAQWAKKWIPSSDGIGLRSWTRAYGRRRQEWNRALTSTFTSSGTFCVYPGLWNPAVGFTTPALFQLNGRVDFLGRLPTWKRLLVAELARVGRGERIGAQFAQLTVWERTNGRDHPAPPERTVSVLRAADQAGSVASTRHPQMLLHTTKATTGRLILTDAGEPVAFIKLSREPDRKLAAEQQALTRVRALIKGTSLQGTVPAWCFQRDGLVTLEYRSGRSLATLASARVRSGWAGASVRRWVHSATRWLIEFQRHTSRCNPLEAAVRVGPIHGDFTPNSVVISPRGELSVINWECFEEGQPVLYDFLTFVTSLGIGSEYRDLFFVRSALARLIQAEVRVYCASLGIPARTLKRFYPGFVEQRWAPRAGDGLWRSLKDRYDRISLFDV